MIRAGRRFSFLLSFTVTFTLSNFSISAMASKGDDYFDLPLESLMNIEVTSVSKKAEKVSEAAAAIYVITAEDIRRGGFTSIPEALRTVPGLQVARIDSNKWAITSRGFDRQFSNKLLVLKDGRSIYTPLFSGVWWDVHDGGLEDVDRIEVIRGPGGTLWGANAVNGVINIITKHSRDTQGSLATAGGGNFEQGFGSVRHGGKIAENSFYRAYARHNERDDTEMSTGANGGDNWVSQQGGFRLDLNPQDQDNITILGEAYQNSLTYRTFPPTLASPFFTERERDVTAHGINTLGRWSRQISPESATTLQFYVDYVARDARKVLLVNEQRLTYDLDFQHVWKVHPKHEVVWGLGYRLIHDELENSPYLTYQPSQDTISLASAFAQDKITLMPEMLFLTLGSKFEHNDYTGFELQPNVRLSWLVNPKNTAWAAVSRAVRTPSRGEDGLTLIGASFPAGALGAGTPAAFVEQIGNTSMDSEKLVAYEIGYRFEPAKTVAFDVATFYNRYDDLRTFERGAAFVQSASAFPAHLVVPLNVANRGSGNSYGLEAAANWNVTDKWRLSASYTFFNLELSLDPGSSDTSLKPEEGNSPHNQFNIRSYLNLPHGFEWDNAIYYVDNLSNARIKNYTRVDTRLGWRATPSLELSLVGQNLLDPRHPEFSESIYARRVEIGRSVFGKATLRF